MNLINYHDIKNITHIILGNTQQGESLGIIITTDATYQFAGCNEADELYIKLTPHSNPKPETHQQFTLIDFTPEQYEQIHKILYNE